MVPLSFKGQVDGNVLVTSLYKNPLLEVNLQVKKFSMLESEFGDFSVVSEWNSEKKEKIEKPVVEPKPAVKVETPKLEKVGNVKELTRGGTGVYADGGGAGSFSPVRP